MEFYRSLNLSESPNRADSSVNDGYLSSLANGGASYRDLPPGDYHVVPESYNL